MVELIVGFGLGIALGMYISSQIEKCISININKKCDEAKNKKQN
tara:strand:- start:4107 stop:4238 length:132 start_codon:yes stop_codon:yes gene_type:complete